MTLRSTGRYRLSARSDGLNGDKVLDETHGPETEYVPTEEEGYVPVCVVASNGSNAWTRPIFLNMEVTIG